MRILAVGSTIALVHSFDETDVSAAENRYNANAELMMFASVQVRVVHASIKFALLLAE